MKSKVLEYFNFEKANALLEAFNQSTGFVTAILDLEGNILSKSGWRQICTQFHRVHPQTAQNCMMSDTEIANSRGTAEKYHFYTCLNGLIDVQIPIVVRGEHIANLYSGQLFFEKPDITFFKRQAMLYGFNETLYLAALEKVPVVSKEKVKLVMNFLLNTIELIIEMTSDKQEQMELNERIKESEIALLENQYRLRKSEERFRIAQEVSPDGFTILHPLRDHHGEITDFTFVYENHAIAHINHTVPQEIIGKRLLELFPAHQGTMLLNAYKQVANTGEPQVLDEINAGEIVSEPVWLRLVVVSMGEDIAIIAQNVTKRKLTEIALAESERKYSSYIENAPDGVFVVDEKGNYIDANQATSRITGFSLEELLKMSIRDLIPDNLIEQTNCHFNKLLETGYCSGELQFMHKNGSLLWWSLDAVKLDERRYLYFSRDINDKKNAESEMLYLSYHDHLTGLHNRRFFEQELKRLDVTQNLPISIIMFDVNGLKLVNDSFGHDAGDLLLKKAAEAIQKACSKEDVVARIGGDEFALLLPHTSSEECVQIANRIKECSSKEKVANIELSISYGYDTKETDKQSIHEIIANAENYMYRYKLFERSSNRSKMTDLIMNTLFEKSSREAAHSKRVSILCETIASAMNLGQDVINKMRIAGLIHDIGKIGVAESILNKPAALTLDERIEVERHPEIGWRLLSSTNEYSELAQLVLNHHERWDGTGYPNKLKGEAISLEARIIAVADAYDAVTSKRSYREALSKEEAIEELQRGSGKQFDPAILDVFIRLVLLENRI